MKTAVSIPEAVFRAGEQVKRRLRISRSELYAKALAVFVREHSGEGVTEALDRVYADQPSTFDPILARLQYASISRKNW
jgi:hypothetical protein